MLHDDKILRVCIHKDRNIVSIVNLDKNALDTTDEGIYINVDDVPDWIQRKLSVLMMVKTYGADIMTPEIEVLKLIAFGYTKTVSEITN